MSRVAKYLISLILLTGTSSALMAQKSGGRHGVSLGWSANIPIGEAQFLSRINAVSPFLTYDYAVSGSFSVGFRAGYAYSRERGETRDRYDGDLVDGYSDRKLTLIPLQAEVRYFPLGDGENHFMPFISVAGGAQYASFHITGGDRGPISTSGSSNWSFAVAPAIGLRIVPGESAFHLDIMVDWQYGGNQWPLMASKYQQFIGIKIAGGIRF